MHETYDKGQESRPNGATHADPNGTGGKAAAGDGIAFPERGRGVVLLLSVTEAARALGLGRSKTYELIASGDLEVVHIGRCSRVPVDAVAAYVERLRGLMN